MPEFNHHLGQRDVVIVEDEDDNRLFVRSVLERHGFTVHAFARANDALDHLAMHPCRVVMSDLRMPGMSGLDFAAEVRRRDPQAAVVLMTAYATVENAIEALRLGAADLLQKPLTVDVLVEKIESLMAAKPALRVLAIGAHPDDVEIGIGGILATHRAGGDSVTVLTLTSGAVGGDAEEREVEARAAAKLLGADVLFGHLPDTQLAQEPRLVGVVEDVIRRIQPEIVYTHCDADLHQDHKATHHATLVASRKVARVYGYQSPSSTVDFAPMRFVPIDRYLDTKLAAISCYRSQVEVREYLADELLTATARYWGRFAGVRYAEPLEVIAERGGLSNLGTTSAVATILENSHVEQ